MTHYRTRLNRLSSVEGISSSLVFAAEDAHVNVARHAIDMHLAGVMVADEGGIAWGLDAVLDIKISVAAQHQWRRKNSVTARVTASGTASSPLSVAECARRSLTPIHLRGKPPQANPQANECPLVYTNVFCELGNGWSRARRARLPELRALVSYL